MTSLRKWRFPILIGSGVLAAAALIYFSNAHIGANKTQGAIGKRDVYRDGQVASADVATPGSAPVATQAILESSEFKTLAKNPAFQQLMRDDAFNELARRDSSFVGLLAMSEFQLAVRDLRFAGMINSMMFQTALKNHADLSVAMQSSLEYHALAESAPMKALFANAAFRSLAEKQLFVGLVDKAYFTQALTDRSFANLTQQMYFLSAIRDGSAQQLTLGTAQRQ